MVHELKTWPEYFDAVYRRVKRFELRINDRNFQVGDVLNLQEYDIITDTYSGRSICLPVTFIMPVAILTEEYTNRGYVIMSLGE